MQEYANVWPQNGLFAFSGVDGETCHAEPFVASGLRESIGWRFWVKPKVVLQAKVGETDIVARRSEEGFCFTDCWQFDVAAGEACGVVRGAFLDRCAIAISLDMPGFDPEHGAELVPDQPGKEIDNALLYECEGCWLAVYSSPPTAERRYGIAISYNTAEEAVDGARQASEADLDQAILARLAFYQEAPIPEALADNLRRAYYKALSVHKVNIESAQLDVPCRWTTPDRMPHRHMWLWDTAFHSIGLQHVRRDLGEDALYALFAKQRDDGKLLLASQPGQPPREESNTQPPIVAWAVYRQFSNTNRTEFIEKLYPQLVRYLEWFEANRKDERGLYGWEIRATDDPIRSARGGESGMDNSPRFDKVESMTAIDLAGYMAAEYLALAKLAEALGKADDETQWRERQQAIAQKVNELLWDDEDRLYYDLDEDGEFIRIKTSAAFMALHGKIADRDRAEALRAHMMNPREFWTGLPVASVAMDEPTFSKDMWRGPTWVNVNVLIYHALRDYGFVEEAYSLARKSLDAIAAWYARYGCLYEYYDATGETAPFALPRKGAPGEAGGVGFGVVEDLQWTAASFVHLANEIH